MCRSSDPVACPVGMLAAIEDPVLNPCRGCTSLKPIILTLAVASLFLPSAAMGNGTELLGRASVVVITVEDKPSWTGIERTDVAETWLARGSDGSGEWWFGSAVPGSTDPMRSLLGFFSGVAPLRLRALDEIEISTLDHLVLTRSLSIDQAFEPAVIARLLGATWRRPELDRLVPGATRLALLRPALTSLEVAEAPFVFWLGYKVMARKRPAATIAMVNRVLVTLEGRGLLEDVVVVVTSVHGSAEGRVPIAIRVGANRQPQPLPPPGALIALESVGATLRHQLGAENSPALTPALSAEDDKRPLLSEIWEDGAVTGVRGWHGRWQLSVRWDRAGMADCWSRRSSARCRWTIYDGSVEVESTTNGATSVLESAVLLELEKLLARSLR